MTGSDLGVNRFQFPDAPELPFRNDCDGIAYEREPWEQARRQRLQQYARLRDELAGIVVYVDRPA